MHTYRSLPIAIGNDWGLLRVGDEPDGQQLIAQPNKNSRKVEASNPIYEGGAVYETMPGESFKRLLSLNEPSSTTTSADSTHHYVDTPPTLPPPRAADATDTQASSEPLDEIDAIKARIKQAQLQLPASHQNGEDEYMIMGPKQGSVKSKGKDGGIMEGIKKTAGSEEFMTDTEDKYVTLDKLR